MPVFRLHLRRRVTIEPDDDGMELRDLHHAYLEVCKDIPDAAREELIAGRDPMVCAYVICDSRGRPLLEVPFAEVLSPAEWRMRRGPRRPMAAPRSLAARNDLALGSFRRMFSTLNVGCVLMTPELEVVEMNEFGARHSHVDLDAIRGASILDIFDLAGKPKDDFTTFMELARTGATSQIVDMPYLVLDHLGRTVNGWWTARTWPIFDDDDRMIGLVEWAEPFTHAQNGGNTRVRVAQGTTG